MKMTRVAIQDAFLRTNVALGEQAGIWGFVALISAAIGPERHREFAIAGTAEIKIVAPNRIGIGIWRYILAKSAKLGRGFSRVGHRTITPHSRLVVTQNDI